MNKGLVSTIIPVYNRPNMLSDAVNSVLRQDYRPIEIIIVDDGSNDDTPTIAKELATAYEEVQVLRISNSGPALARESGRQLARGEFIQYLDSDDLLSPTKFSLQVTALNERPDCGVSYCQQEYCDMNGNVLDSAWMRSNEVHHTMFPAMLEGRLWGTPVPLYRKTLLDQCGPWQDLKNQEDWEYDCRVASKGVNLNYVNRTLVTIRNHQQGHYGEFINDKQKLRDRAHAHLAIYNHALTANISPQSTELKSFLHGLFLLCRQCGSQGLIVESKALFDLVKNTHSPLIQRRIKYTFYRFSTLLLGWRLSGSVSLAIGKVFK